MKSKLDKLDMAKLETTPVNLTKLSDLLENDVVKKNVYNAKIKKYWR